MSDETLRVEVIASTLLLLAPQTHPCDIRPSLLAAQLSADKQCAEALDQRRWQREYGRVLTLLGWHLHLSEQRIAKRPARGAWAIIDQLARGIGRHCTPQRARQVARALASLADGAADSPAMQVLRAHAWHGSRLNLQVALLETDGCLATYGIGFEAQEPPPTHWLGHRFAPARVQSRSSMATLSRELYAPLEGQLKRKLGAHLDTAMAAL